ncbi:MAG: hypothetical protein DCC68_21265 [Planctomycetota bacterium]|nr:MAG: hypothetical protein DCC68_21265 [Planctomycetota bacterium]
MTFTLQLSDFARELLVKILARADGLHVPFREPDSIAWALIHEGIVAFRETGAIPWNSASRDNAQAKANERALAELADAKLVERLKIRGVGARTSDVILRPEGFALAGELVGQWRHREALWAADETARLSRELTGRPDVFVAEIEFSEPRGVGWGDGKQAEVGLTQALNLPALTAGFLDFNCTVRRHGAYRVTREGSAAVEAATPEELAYADPPKADKRLAKIYDRELANARDTWRAKDERSQSIGEIPLAASGGPEYGGFAMSKREVAHA